MRRSAGGPSVLRSTRASDPPPPELEGAARNAARRSVGLSFGHPRGAALLTSGGKIFQASEIGDPDAVGVGACAEQAAAIAAVLAGARGFRALLIRGGRTGREDGGPPCGRCLQFLLEFSPTARIWWGTRARPQGGQRVLDLLPGAFQRTHLSGRETAGAAPAPKGPRP